MGVAEFEEGVRILAQLTTSDVEIGTRVRPAYGRLREKAGKIEEGFRLEKV